MGKNNKKKVIITKNKKKEKKINTDKGLSEEIKKTPKRGKSINVNNTIFYYNNNHKIKNELGINVLGELCFSDKKSETIRKDKELDKNKNQGIKINIKQCITEKELKISENYEEMKDRLRSFRLLLIQHILKREDNFDSFT